MPLLPGDPLSLSLSWSVDSVVPPTLVRRELGALPPSALHLTPAWALLAHTLHGADQKELPGCTWLSKAATDQKELPGCAWLSEAATDQKELPGCAWLSEAATHPPMLCASTVGAALRG